MKVTTLLTAISVALPAWASDEATTPYAPRPILDLVSYQTVSLQRQFPLVDSELFGLMPTPLVLSVGATPFVARDTTGTQITKVELINKEEKERRQKNENHERKGRKSCVD
jgi:hypothetical protein